MLRSDGQNLYRCAYCRIEIRQYFKALLKKGMIRIVYPPLLKLCRYLKIKVLAESHKYIENPGKERGR